jgi:large subunit ribosomal protein L15
MQLNNLIPRTKNKKTMIVGRGGTRGKTSGRGTKGQNSRSGHKKRPELRDFIKRIPKLRGRGVNSNKTIETKRTLVYLTQIEAVFEAGAAVNPKTLAEKAVISTVNGRIPYVKILATGEVTKKFNITNCILSAGAKAKIEKAGGTVK